MLHYNYEALGFACCPKYTADSDQSVETTINDELRLDFLLVVLSNGSSIYWLYYPVLCMQK